MKVPRTIWIGAASVALLQGASGQDFMNLDFELANPSGYSADAYIPSGTAFPNWTTYWSGSSDPTAYSSSLVGYDAVSGSSGPAFIVLEDSNAPSGVTDFNLSPIQGNYSALLQGSQGVTPPPGISSSIGQTGTIPSTAKSLVFFGRFEGNLQVTFDGQNILFSAVGSGADYMIYAADISRYAGQTGQLLFTAPDQTTALLDNIQFSPLSVPEPSGFTLGTLGAFLAVCCRFLKRPNTALEPTATGP